MGKIILKQSAKEVKRLFTISRIKKIRYHIEEVELPLNKLSKTDMIKIIDLRERFKQVIFKAKLINIFRYIVAIIAYASVITAIFSVIPFLDIFKILADLIIGVVGFTVLIAILTITTFLINVYANEANMIATRMIIIFEYYRMSNGKK
ncbi:MAG: hypothetical protein V1740_03860 [Candidatus Woesearchaeota archaeon]